MFDGTIAIIGQDWQTRCDFRRSIDSLFFISNHSKENKNVKCNV